MTEEDLSNFAIPRTLDAPKMFLLWELDVAMLFLIIVILFAAMGAKGFLFGIGVAIVISRGFLRLKVEGGKGLLKRVLYWFAPSEWASQKLQSHIRERVG
ncbi:type IV conjugative transfer system protein TraL [uncultured Microbulbifer sp.]|uniref:type IV conjugative transfer system protein TraL n=1 Tax=uncultured Microbulbifer sp. TaxID=348147 RepID=UPI002627C9CE|nr:type IV conjugative transfer system protein TraL [uncultured Microbulbifer sp.]